MHARPAVQSLATLHAAPAPPGGAQWPKLVVNWYPAQ
jgi:hypothetical protein